jgi:hypothetical protein
MTDFYPLSCNQLIHEQMLAGTYDPRNPPCWETDPRNIAWFANRLSGKSTTAGASGLSKAIPEGFQLTSNEAAIVIAQIERDKHKAPAGVNEVKFLNACLWFMRAKERGLPLTTIPPSFGFYKTQHGRMVNWHQRKMFNRLYDNLIVDNKLNSERLKDFQVLADYEIERNRASISKKV